MDDDFDVEVSALTLSRKFRKTDLLVLALDMVAGVSEAISTTLGIARDCSAMHANWRADQDIFHEEAALEIENIVNGDED